MVFNYWFNVCLFSNWTATTTIAFYRYNSLTLIHNNKRLANGLLLLRWKWKLKKKTMKIISIAFNKHQTRKFTWYRFTVFSVKVAAVDPLQCWFVNIVSENGYTFSTPIECIKCTHSKPKKRKKKKKKDRLSSVLTLNVAN